MLNVLLEVNVLTKEVKVIAIPDNTRIIINYGYEDDPENSSIFGGEKQYAKIGQQIVVESKGMDLKDPDTDEKIGSYNPPIDYLEITDVRPKYSIARKKERKDANSASIPPLIKEASKTKFEKLNVKASDVKNIKPNPSISVGDIVEFVD